MSTSKKRHPLRKLLFLAVLVGIATAVKNALADKGGSYDAPAAPTRVPTPPTPNAPKPAADPVEAPAPVAAETIDEKRPVENLDEFADPVVSDPAVSDPAAPGPLASDPAGSDSVAEYAPPAEHRRTRKRSSATEAVEKAEQSEDDAADATRKIDPFGIR